LPLAVTKTEVISVRVPPDVKAALVLAAAGERRSLATMLEVMVLDYCKARGLGPAMDAGEMPLPMTQRAALDLPSATDKNN
jgi:hypothetical protein